jgi:proprotein convertase subtilisin/kexin type 5
MPGLCTCMLGYFDNGVALCANCSYKCESCSGSSTNCLTCRSGSYRSGAACDCSSGYYEVNPGVSLTCS